MEVVVQEVVVRLRKAMAIPGDNQEAIKVVEAEVLALVRSGHASEVSRALAAPAASGAPHLLTASKQPTLL